MPGRVYNDLFDLAGDQHGYVTTADAKALGINPLRLQDLVRRGQAERIDHGLYRLNAVPPTAYDQYREATLWPVGVRGVLSHATALDLHDLCDIDPARIHVTVPRGYRITREVPALYAVHHRDLTETERTLVDGIPIVTPFRAILDGIQDHLGANLTDQAIIAARDRGLLRPEELRMLERQIVGAF